MTITLLPTPPDRSDPANFAARADAFLAALPTFGEEVNATVRDLLMNISGVFGTSSTTSHTIGTGTKAFTVDTGLAVTPGMPILISSAANRVNWMFGIVSSYSGADLSVAVTHVSGSGTYTDWEMGMSGPPSGATDVQIFNSSGTWTKPSGGQTMAIIECIGGGGGGGGSKGGGGGGGGYARLLVALSSLGSTVSVTVGSGGTAGGPGGTSSFGTWLHAYGGGAGYPNSSGGGGGGGGSLATGSNGGSSNGGAGAVVNTIAGGAGGSASNGGDTAYDAAGGGGGAGNVSANAYHGGSATWGGGGGGGGTQGVYPTGYSGNGGNSIMGGGGGAGGSSYYGTGGTTKNPLAGNGGAGSVGGAGGGGGSGSTSTGYAGGAGRVRITCF